MYLINKFLDNCTLYAIISLLISPLGSSKAQQQIKSPSEYMQNLNLKPEVAALFQHKKVELINAHGNFQYNIPLFTITSKRMNTPINLSYTSNSINPDRFAPNYGLNWFLTGEGSIIRTIKGVADKTKGTIDRGNGRGHLKDGAIVGWFNWDLFHQKTSIKMDEEEKYLINNIDTQPDIYHCKAPGLNVKFVFDHNKKPIVITGDEVVFAQCLEGLIDIKTLNVSFQGKPLHKTGIDNHISDFIQFDIISKLGIKYIFSAIDIAFINSSSNNQLIGQLNYRPSTWRLTKMIDLLSNEEITFNYDLKNETKLERRLYSLSAEGNFTNNLLKLGTQSSYYMYSALLEWNQLKSIESNNEIVEFNYETNDRLDKNNDFALDNITIKAKIDAQPKYDIIKVIEFSTSYFKDRDNNESCLKLDNLIIKSSQNEEKHYSFNYLDFYDVKIPRVYDVNTTDIYGHLITNATSNTWPLLYYKGYIPTHSTEKTLTPYKPEKYINTIGEKHLESSEKELTVGLLNEIKLPTGGKLDIRYERNSFNNKIQGNGARVKELITKSNTSYEANIHQEFTYSEGKLYQFPQFTSNNRVYRLPVNLSACNKVFYSEIKESRRLGKNDKGYISRRFYPPSSLNRIKSYSNWKSNYCNINSKQMLLVFEGDRYSALSELSPISGQLSDIEIYSNKNKLLLSKKYGKNLISFGNTSIDYEIINSFSYENIDWLAYGAGATVSKLSYKRWAVVENYRTEFFYDEKTNNYIYNHELNKYRKNIPLLSYNAKLISSTDNKEEREYNVSRYYYPDDLIGNYPNLEFEPDDSPQCKALKFLTKKNIHIPLYIQNSIVETKLTKDREDKEIIKTTIKNISGNYIEYERNLIGGNTLTLPSTIYREIIKERSYSHSFNERLQSGDYFTYDIVDFFFDHVEKKIKFRNDVKVQPVEQFSSYDEKGSILQYKKQDGITQSIVWGYNANYPFIIAANIEYSKLKKEIDDILILLGYHKFNPVSSRQTTINYDKFFADLGHLKEPIEKNLLNRFVDELKDRLPDVHFKINTFKPSIGITSQTDANGQTLYFYYDEFGRLETAKDNDSHILKNYKYNYSQQPSH